MRPFVLCIHSFSSSGAQYRALAERLAGGFEVAAPDLYGHGTTPPWTAARAFTLCDEAVRLEALLPEDGPIHLVAHSYGAAVALRLAARHRSRIASMALYEPAIWGTLSQLCPGDEATLEIEAVRDETVRLIDAGRLEAAAERFVDYWTGAGAWAAMPAERRAKLVATMGSLRAGWIATFAERWTAAGLGMLDMPCLLITGSRSTAAARRAIRLLAESLPAARGVELEPLGHLGPITHPREVNAAIASFLACVTRRAA